MPMLATVALSTVLLSPISFPYGPVCGLPEVLDVVAQELAAQGVHGGLDERSVGERSMPGGATVLCAVKVLLPYYDTDHFGYAPQFRLVVRTYRVRRQPNSLLVDLLD